MKDVEKEVASLFIEDIWKLIPIDEMIENYTKQRNDGKDSKRE